MHLIVIYDITHDGTRTKIATTLEDYGLDRIQYSAFYGRLTRTHQEEVMLKIKRILGKRAGKIELIPISADTWDKRITLTNDREEGNPPDA